MTTTRHPPARDHSLDALRTLAVIGMMAAHTARLMPFDVRPEWARLVLLLEPVIPSLFLFLVGLSLALSFQAARRRAIAPGVWYRRQLGRAAWLWAISAAFFALEMGIRLPDMLLAGGILANIAYAIALLGGLMALASRGRADSASPIPRAVPLALSLAFMAGAALFVGFDLAGARVHPVNIGNSPFLPLWLFALAGGLCGMTGGRLSPSAGEGRVSKRRVVTAAIGLLGALVATALIARYGLDALFTKPLGRSDATRLIPSPVYGGAPLDVGYYNIRPVLALACLGLHVAALAVLRATARAGERGAPLFAIGRHALGAYVVHLALLAALVVSFGERQPLKSAAPGTFVWLGLIVICHALALLRERTDSTLRK